jgi:hypothetical protein
VSRRIFDLTGSPVKALAGLHHDDSEAYLLDVPRPMKPLVQPYYGEMTDRMDTAICEALRLPFTTKQLHSPYIKEADNWALLIEARHLMRSGGINWAGSAMERMDPPATPEYWLGGIDSSAAGLLFLKEHARLSSLLELGDI